MATLVGVMLVCGGVVALLVAVVSRCGAYGRRAVSAATQNRPPRAASK